MRHWFGLALTIVALAVVSAENNGVGITPPMVFAPCFPQSLHGVYMTPLFFDLLGGRASNTERRARARASYAHVNASGLQ